MVFKNGLKEYALMACLSAVSYGIIMGKVLGDMTIGLIAGVFFGVLFTLCMSLFTKNNEKKSALIRAEISRTKKIVCEGPANQQQGVNAVGGWLFVTVTALEFYPHKLNLGGQSLLIPLSEITGAAAKGNKLVITTKAGITFSFVVNKSKLWQQTIASRLQPAYR